MYELSETNPELNQGQLFKSGMRVGREILATSANTIYLAYFGGQLTLFSGFQITLFIWSYHQFQNFRARIRLDITWRHRSGTQHSYYSMGYSIYD